MNSHYIQNARYKLQKRVRRLNSSSIQLYQSVLKQFLNFFEHAGILAGIASGLVAKYPQAKDQAIKIVKENQGLLFDNEEEHAAVSYHVLGACAESGTSKAAWTIGRIYTQKGDAAEALAGFNDQFLEPFYDYVDEHLDDVRAALGLLRRYKHKVEWFNREMLYRLATDDTQHGEKKLAYHLYEYLHDQGIDSFIEPSSASGKPDVIGGGEEPLIADTKIFAPSSGKGTSYIIKGFHQVYLYTLDFNEPVGFVIIYNLSGDDLKFALTDKAQSTPLVTHNGKTIFFVVIDIFPHETPASKRGQLKCHEITADELVKVIEQQNPVT